MMSTTQKTLRQQRRSALSLYGRPQDGAVQNPSMQSVDAPRGPPPPLMGSQSAMEALQGNKSIMARDGSSSCLQFMWQPNMLQVAKFLDAGMKRLQTVDPNEGSYI